MIKRIFLGLFYKNLLLPFTHFNKKEGSQVTEKPKKKDLIEVASKGLLSTVDNFAFQVMKNMVQGAKLKEDELVTVTLNACPHCKKQRIVIDDAENEDFESEQCIFCEKPVDVRVVAYRFTDDEGEKMLYCTEKEAESLIEEK